MEIRFLTYYGNVNEQMFMGMGDLAAGKSVRFDYKFSSPACSGLDGIAVDNVGYALEGGYTATGYWFHTVRVTALGDVVRMYLDDDPTPVVTTIPLTYPGAVSPNGLNFGIAGIIADIDYICWTNEGAFAPIPEPATMVLLLTGTLVLRNRSVNCILRGCLGS